MKRKRVLGVIESSIEPKKIKKQKAISKNENVILDKNSDEPMMETVKPSKKKEKRLLPKGAMNEVQEPGTSDVSIVKKKKKKHVATNVHENDNTGKEMPVLKKKKNIIKPKTPPDLRSDSPSDFITLGDLLKHNSSQFSEKQSGNVKETKKGANKKKSGSGSVLKTCKKNSHLESMEVERNTNNITLESGYKKTKKKVRIDETEGLKIKKELAEAESHFSAKQLPAKIIKSKSNKSLTEEVKVSPLTVQLPKKDKKVDKKPQKDTKEDKKDFLNTEIKLEDFVLDDEQTRNGIDYENNDSSEESDLEVYYINKNAEKEAKKKSLPKKHSIIMPKEDQLILVHRIQDVIPEEDTKSYKYRLQNLEWQKVAFKNYTLDDCQGVWAQLLKKVRHYRLLREITLDVKQVIELNDLQELRKNKTNTKKHPDMPKRPLTSYFLYYIRKRDKISKEKPELDTVELNKFISERYQNLPIEKKQKYEQLAAKNRSEYKKQLDEFYEKHPEMKIVKAKQTKKKERKEKPPKRPENPFKLFMQAELTADISDEDKTEFKEVCREKWRHLSDAKKLCWINLAEEHHIKYQEEMKEYMAKYPEYTPKGQKPILSREELNIKDKLAGKPKKPPGSAYGLFISMTMQSQEIVDIPPRERWNYTSTRWKAMADEEREQYKQLLAQVQEQYESDFKAYLDSLPEDKRQEEILKNLPKKRKNAATDKPKTPKTKSTNIKQKIANPTPPARSAYKYFVEKYEGENSKEAWKGLSQDEKDKFEQELNVIKEKYIKDFEAYLKSLTKEELSAFCANRSTQEDYSSSDESDSESDNNGQEESSEDSSNTFDSQNESEEEN